MIVAATQSSKEAIEADIGLDTLKFHTPHWGSLVNPEDVFGFHKVTDDLLAVCSIRRTGSVRKENFFFKIGKKNGWCS